MIRIGRQRELVEELHDRGAIEPRSWSVQGGINSTIVRQEVVRICSEIDAQSTYDQATIVVDPGEKHGQEEAEIMAKLRPIHGQSRSCDVAPRNRSHYLSNRLHDRLQLATIFGPISSLKTHVTLLCSSTFDRFMKEISEFRGRSLVHRDPPVLRLNSEGIGAGLITNSSLISSNFPHEFRKSVRKDPSKFTPIRANWSLILVAIGLVVRFDRLSRGNLSFY